MAKKSSKTAHVLNLLTNAKDENSEPVAQGSSNEPVLENAPAEVASSVGGRIEIENATEDPISDLVREELESALEKKDASVPAPAPAPSSAHRLTEGDTMLAPKQTNEGGFFMSENKNNAPMSIEESAESGYVSVNIVEDIVKSKAPEFVKKMGGCTCYRCINDVIAIALNMLPPKYIVTHKGMLFAKVSSFENQYSIDIASALTKATLAVKGSPRH